jgi:hypothetical protein
MKKETKHKTQEIEQEQDNELKDFSLEAKRNILDIINDCPSLVMVGEKEYRVKNMRFYSLYRICKIAMDMKINDETMDDDNKILTALCTDLDSMCEIMAIILCNHRFVPDKIDIDTADDVMEYNDKIIKVMKAKVMNSTYDINQWAAIIIGAIQSIDLGGFFLLKKSVSTVTDSLMKRKMKSQEIVSQFMEAQSLEMQATS